MTEPYTTADVNEIRRLLRSFLCREAGYAGLRPYSQTLYSLSRRLSLDYSNNQPTNLRVDGLKVQDFAFSARTVVRKHVLPSNATSLSNDISLSADSACFTTGRCIYKGVVEQTFLSPFTISNWIQGHRHGRLLPFIDKGGS